MKSVIVIAPHPDDETLGCGGTLLRHRDKGDRIHWLIATAVTGEGGYSQEAINKRTQEVQSVATAYGFDSVHTLGFPCAALDQVPFGKIVNSIGAVFKEVSPNVVYLPYRSDVHTDHRIVFDAVVSCTKWFRYAFVEKVLAYETLSETGFGLDPDSRGFQPNLFVNIASYLDRKTEIFSLFEGESGQFPFPRCEETIRAQAILRGSSAGFGAAEAFMLLREKY